MFDREDYRLTKDWHTHTIYSDGVGTIEDNVKAAVDKGLDSIALTEHGFNHFLYGVKRDKIAEMRDEIARLREIYKIEILLGIEANPISWDGKLDLTLEECESFDVVNVGLHRAVKYSKFSEFFSLFTRNMMFETKKHSEKLSQMYVKVMENYPITTIVHLHEYQHVDIRPIVEKAVKSQVNIELNAKHLLFNQEEVNFMDKAGAKFIIGSDAHAPEKVGVYTKVQDFLEKTEFPIEKIINLVKKNNKNI